MKRSICICLLLVLSISVMVLGAQESDSLVGTWQRVSSEGSEWTRIIIEKEVWSEQEGYYIVKGHIMSKEGGNSAMYEKIEQGTRNLNDGGGNINLTWWQDDNAYTLQSYGFKGAFNSKQDKIEGTFYHYKGEEWVAQDTWEFEKLSDEIKMPTENYKDELDVNIYVKRVSGGMDIRIKNTSNKTWDHTNIEIYRIRGSGWCEKSASLKPKEEAIIPWDERVCSPEGKNSFKVTVEAYKSLGWEGGAKDTELIGTTEKKVDLSSICEDLLAEDQEKPEKREEGAVQRFNVIVQEGTGAQQEKETSQDQGLSDPNYPIKKDFGHQEFTVTAPKNQSFWRFFNKHSYKDPTIKLTASHVSSLSGKPAYGIVFGAKDDENFYAFLVENIYDPTHKEKCPYTLVKSSKGSWTHLTEWKKSEHVNCMGKDTLKVVSKDGLLGLYVNGHLLEVIEATGSQRGQIGFIGMGVEQDAKFTVKKLSVSSTTEEDVQKLKKYQKSVDSEKQEKPKEKETKSAKENYSLRLWVGITSLAIGLLLELLGIA